MAMKRALKTFQRREGLLATLRATLSALISLASQKLVLWIWRYVIEKKGDEKKRDCVLSGNSKQLWRALKNQKSTSP